MADHDLDNKDYSIYNYFKDNPGFLLGLLSLITGIVITITYCLFYYCDIYSLKHWGIDTQFADFSNKTRLYLVGSHLFVLYLCFVVIFYLESFSSSRYHYFDALALNKAWEMDISRNNHDKLREIINSNNRHIISSSIRHDLFYKLFLPLIIIYFVVFFIDYYVFDSLKIFFRQLIPFSVFFCYCVMEMRWLYSHQIKYYYYKITINEISPLEKIEEIRKPDFKEYFSNTTIKNILFYCLCFLLVLFSIIYFQNRSDTINQDTFPITNYNDTYIVIVYTSTDKAILLNAKIDDDTIIIDRSKQEIVSLAPISYAYYKFEKVIID